MAPSQSRLIPYLSCPARRGSIGGQLFGNRTLGRGDRPAGSWAREIHRLSGLPRGARFLRVIAPLDLEQT